MVVYHRDPNHRCGVEDTSYLVFSQQFLSSWRFELPKGMESISICDGDSFDGDSFVSQSRFDAYAISFSLLQYVWTFFVI